ncbi:MAG: hypothetical protein KDE20_09300 [Caldilineaceae bacterium]|nr:hypothetical protein [Caldilineaceae bacterium]
MKASFNSRPYVIISGINALLLLITAAAGLFVAGTYDNFIAPLHLAESQGQDATTLFVGLPLLIVALLWTRQGAVQGPILWAGAMGYFLYIYLIYAYGGVYNWLFFAYVAVCGLSLFALIGILLGIDAEEVARRVTPTMPTWWIAGYFAGTALLLTLMWGGLAFAAMAAGETADANVIIVTDLIVVIPAFALAAVWLWQGLAWGYVLSGVLFVQAVTLGISIVAGQLVALIKGVEPAWGLAGFFLAFTMLGLVLALLYFKNLRA